MAIIFVSGVNDRSTIGVDLDEAGNPVYLVDGNCSVHLRLPLRDGVAVPFMIFGHGVPQRMPEFATAPSLIFNQIADADTHRGALERCVQFCDEVGTTVVNHPRQVLQTTREQVSERLQGIPGVIMPRAVRFQPRSPDAVLSHATAQGVGFPFIVRVAGEHRGRSMVRLDRAGDLPALHALPFDGRDYYLVEYVDFRDADGFCHKQRIVVIDGEPLLRHALYSDDWVVHASARHFMMERESWKDDAARFERISGELLPALRPAIDEITTRLGLEYYGIDCSIRPDGRMLVFEANANMNVLHGNNPTTRRRLEPIEQRLYALLARCSGERVI